MTEIPKINLIENAFNILFRNKSNNYIFIYTPPKVGSTTLVSSLRVSLGNSYNIVHIHDDLMLNVLTGINDVSVNELIQYIANNGGNIFVIDVYRTPVERKMSEYFEKLSTYHFNNTEENINKYSVVRVANRFNKLFPHLAIGEHYFDKFEIENPIPFDFEKKYTLQIINNVQFIKLRLLDSHIWDSILSNVLKRDIVMIKDYQTDNKGIGGLYKTFKSEYKLPENYFDSISKCKYLDFYYSEQEKSDYLNKWSNKISNIVSTPYSQDEYNFYVNLYLENQIYNDIQTEHYLDNGCTCKICSNKRIEYFHRAKKGEQLKDKIIHIECVNEVIRKNNEKAVNIYKQLIHVKNANNNKAKPKNFSINYKLQK